MGKRPQILLVSPLWVLPTVSGAHQRVLNVFRLLSRVGDVSLAIAESWAPGEESIRLTRREFDVRMVMQARSVAPGGPLERVRCRFRHDFDPRYLETSPKAITESDRTALMDLIKEHDLVWVHNVVTANLCRIYKWPHSVLDIDDIPSGWYRSLVQSADSPLQRLSDLRRSWIWRRRERLLAERFDVLTVCSEEDRRYLGSQPRIHVLPNGYSMQPMRRRPSLETPRIGFIGGLNWAPNKDGIEWFARDVWPVVKHQVPHAQLRLVGRESDRYRAEPGLDIQGLGWLEDPSDEIATWSAMIVPIRFGAGTRAKVAEGFARKCPMVATGIGAFGYDVRNGEEILLADEADKFAAACIGLLQDLELGKTLAERAYQSFLQQWTWDSFAGTIESVVQEALAGKNGARGTQPVATSVLKDATDVARFDTEAPNY